MRIKARIWLDTGVCSSSYFLKHYIFVVMTLNDSFYGSFEIEDVLADLISSAAVQRLRNVHQGGAIFLVSPTVAHSRYEHSIGVMLLVRKLGGSLAEQIASLLHDISHTAFSHVVDYVLKQQGEDYHEQIFDEVIAKSTIPAILANHGFTTDLLNDAKHTLLEMPLPNLCADRIDYTIRDLYHAKLVSLDEIHDFVADLGVQEGKIGVKSERTASWFTHIYRLLNDAYFRKPEHVFANIQFAKLIAYGLDQGIIVLSDLWEDDPTVLAMMKSDTYLNGALEKIKNLDGFEAFLKDQTATGFKERVISPMIINAL